MKRIETLQREARALIRDERRWREEPNGVDQLEIARALDKLRAAERVLRRAFDKAGAR